MIKKNLCKKIIFLILCMLFINLISISLINSLDNPLLIVCGGNNELIIGCLNSQDLIFLGGLPNKILEGDQSLGSEKPKEVIIPPPIIIKEKSFLSLFFTDVLEIFIILILIIFICWLIFFRKIFKRS